MQKLTNMHDIPLSMAVWLANDGYDRIYDPKYFSATDFNRPVKQLVLGKRAQAKGLDESVDISTLVASRMGTAIHDSIENVWTNKRLRDRALEALGYPKKVIDCIVVNPDPEITLHPTTIPVYMEIRKIKEFQGFKIGGKFDFLAEGRLEDFKSTKTWGYVNGGNTDDYIRQASIYRWLNQDIVNQEIFNIDYIFTDWMRGKVAQDPKYPKTQALSAQYKLMSIEDTEAFLANKLHTVNRYMDAPESDIPPCDDEELWRKDSQFKYYKNPEKTLKSTKNFKTLEEAQARQIQDGMVGIIQEKKGSVMRCNFCPAFDQCTQKDAYIEDGTLEVS